MKHRLSRAAPLLLCIGFFGSESPSSLAQPIIGIEPSSYFLELPGATRLDVAISNVQDLFAYQFTVDFNPAVLSAFSVTEGSFLPGVLSNPTLFVPGTIDNIAGTISFISNALVGATEGEDGSGVLAVIEFFAKGIGTSAVSLSNVVLLDSTLTDISFTEVGATVRVPEPATWLLLGAGLLGLGLARKSRGALEPQRA